MRQQGKPSPIRKDGTLTFSQFTTLALIITSAAVAGAMCAVGEAGELKGFSPDLPRLDGSYPEAVAPLFGP